MKSREKTKRILSESIGIPYEQIKSMSEDELQEYVEKKIGKKVGWPEGKKIEGLPIRPLEEESMETPSRSERFRQMMKLKKDPREAITDTQKESDLLTYKGKAIRDEEETR